MSYFNSGEVTTLLKDLPQVSRFACVATVD